jgi:CheY-like chemotaxis protein
VSKSILVVEDDTDIRDNLRELLEMEGYQVKTARHGQDALRILKETLAEPQTHLPHLICLDLMMDVMDGWTFLAHKEKEERLCGIPVLVLSAARDNIPSTTAGFIRKPIDLDNLLLQIEKFALMPAAAT